MTDLRLFAVTEKGVVPLAVPPDAKSFDDLFGQFVLGVYSAFRTFDHDKFLRLDEHLARTERSMVLLGWVYGLDRGRLCLALHEVCSAYPFPEMRVRFDVLAEPIWVGGVVCRELIGLMPFEPPPARLYEEGVTADLVRELSRHRPLVKTADFAAQRHHYLETHTNTAYEYLMVDENGRILEGTSTNFYGVRGGVVYTAGEGVLEGITRQIILEVIHQLRIPLQLEAIHVDEISQLDEAAISGSSRALLPVVKIGQQVVGNGRSGPLSRRILAAYNELVEREIKPAISR